MMSTPVTNLPANGNPASIPQLTQEQDTIINNVLQEMEKEMEKSTVVKGPAAVQQQPQQMPMQMPPMPMPMQMDTFQPMQMYEGGGKYSHLWDLASFQKAVVASAIAYLILRPEVSGFILARIPALQQFAQYEWVLRILLLILVFYGLMMYLNL